MIKHYILLLYHKIQYCSKQYVHAISESSDVIHLVNNRIITCCK